MLTLCNPDKTWSLSINPILPSQLIRDFTDFEDTNEIQVLVGKTDTPKETIDAINKLRLLLKLADVIHRFNTSKSKKELPSLKEHIRVYYQEWKKLPHSDIYLWFFPDNELSSIVAEFEKDENTPARWYQTRSLVLFKSTFSNICRRGHIRIAKWIVALGYTDITHELNDVFNLTCIYGHLDIAQWLYSLGGIDIHRDSDLAFRSACKWGHLHIAQWLYSLGGVDSPLWMASNNSHSHIIKWLFSLPSFKLEPSVTN